MIENASLMSYWLYGKYTESKNKQILYNICLGPKIQNLVWPRIYKHFLFLHNFKYADSFCSETGQTLVRLER